LLLDYWLLVVAAAALCEILLLAFLGSDRFGFGWWAGRLFGLASASVVLLVLLAEMTRLYAMLLRSVSAERREREARLATLEALSASIAHEVNQPLASMVINANAGLRWLGNERPDLEEVRAALQRIVKDGHRADQVVESIRTVFKKGARQRARVAVNEAIRQALERAKDDLRAARVAFAMDLEEGLPPVSANPLQLQQVVSNLVANALEALLAVPAAERRLRVQSRLAPAGEVLVSIEDSGPGLDPVYKERLFEPFFTTKADGMGMGLLICQSIVESHGGHLEATDARPRGTVFTFSLPADIQEARDPQEERLR
jgi:C4-dicarboxylate-specific signal transduction histidine kinase